jgi:hypothetical protein
VQRQASTKTIEPELLLKRTDSSTTTAHAGHVESKTPGQTLEPELRRVVVNQQDSSPSSTGAANGAGAAVVTVTATAGSAPTDNAGGAVAAASAGPGVPVGVVIIGPSSYPLATAQSVLFFGTATITAGAPAVSVDGNSVSYGVAGVIIDAGSGSGTSEGLGKTILPIFPSGSGSAPTVAAAAAVAVQSSVVSAAAVQAGSPASSQPGVIMASQAPNSSFVQFTDPALKNGTRAGNGTGTGKGGSKGGSTSGAVENVVTAGFVVLLPLMMILGGVLDGGMLI